MPTAKKTTKKKTKAKPKKTGKAKPKKTAKATAKKKPAAKKRAAKTKVEKPTNQVEPIVASEVEQQVASLLKDYEDGNIDNAFDVIGDMYELDNKLPKSSPLRAAFDKMYGEIGEICAESAGA